jgi:hypothetical protein
MKAIHNILAILLFVSMAAFIPQDTSEDVMDCASKAGPSAVYLKDFQVNLPAAAEGQRPPMFQQAIVLRGNNLYRFNLCNKQGEAVLRIYDSSRMLLSSFDAGSGKEYNPIQFLCKKTGPYNIVITMKDGKAGESIGIMSHVKISESRRSR